MNAITRSALSAYKKVSIEAGVETADPQKLILMLFEGAQVSINAARQHMSHNEIAQKGTAISKAITIIENGLKASLDTEKGGDIAQKLEALYDYMIYRLITANLKNKIEMLDEVSKLLSELQGAWAAISTPNISHHTAAPNQPQPAELITLSYGKV